MTLSETFTRYEYELVALPATYFDELDIGYSCVVDEVGWMANWIYYTEPYWLVIDCICEK